MPHYLISFNDGDMKFPQEDLPLVAEDDPSNYDEGN